MRERERERERKGERVEREGGGRGGEEERNVEKSFVCLQVYSLAQVVWLW